MKKMTLYQEIAFYQWTAVTFSNTGCLIQYTTQTVLIRLRCQFYILFRSLFNTIYPNVERAALKTCLQAFFIKICSLLRKYVTGSTKFNRNWETLYNLCESTEVCTYLFNCFFLFDGKETGNLKELPIKIKFKKN